MDVIYNFALENFTLFFSLFLLAVLLGTMSAVTIYLYKVVSYKFKDLIKIIFKGNNDYHVLNQKSARLIDDVNERLAILTSEMKASRGYIIEFHNGSIFLSEQPSWKMSINYEKSHNRSKYLGPKFKNVSVSLYWDNLIKLFFFDLVKGNLLPDGISIMTKNLICDSEIFPRYVYLADTARLTYSLGPLRSNLESHKIDYLLFTPILNHGNLPVGFIGMEYNSNNFNSAMCADDWTACPICQFASYLTYVWSMDKEQLKFYNNGND